MRKIVVFEKLVIYVLLFMPLFFYSYLIFPAKPSIEFMSLKFTSIYYEDIQGFLWTIYLKTNIIVILSLWFLTNRQWWRFAIVPFLFFSIFEFTEVLNDEFLFIAKLKSIKNYSIISFFSIPFFLLIDKFINYKPLTFREKLGSDTQKQLEELIKFDKKKFSEFNLRLKKLDEKKNKMTEKEYLIKLLTMQVELDEYIE